MSRRISYLEETDPDINSDILTRKEFLLYQPSEESVNIIPRFLIKNAAEKGNYLNLTANQLFVRNYLNPNTKYSRLLIKWETGVGKTAGALSIALNFINYYQKQDEYLAGDLSIGSVFILGFTQQIFRDELFKYPEFGFISREELDRLTKIKKQAYSGNASNIEFLKKFNIMLKKRLHSRKGNGFFKFMGYKELTNHLFISKAEGISLHSLSDTEILELTKTGKIHINQELLNTFANSLLICDEIHNLYNSNEKNNWGAAIQTVLNYHRSCRAVFLSATPLNNSPTEIVDLLNLLLPRQYYKTVEKSDLFDKQDNLLKSGEEDLKKYFTGRISYIRNRNPKYMAVRNLIGETIPGIDYLKFIRCPMSNFQYKTYKNEIDNRENLGLEGQYLTDFVIPDPQYKLPYTELGLFKSKEIAEKLNDASQQWRSSIGISYNPKKGLISGPALKKESLGTISMKYKTMLEDVLNNITKRRGKMFIYHNNIHVSGTLFIQEILYQNGIIGEFDNSFDNTLCSMCGRARKDHKKDQLIRNAQGGGNADESLDQLMDELLTPVGNGFILQLGNFDKLINAQDTEEFKKLVLHQFETRPVMIEVSKQDVDNIKLLAKKNLSFFVAGGQIYFYSRETFPYLQSDKDELEYIELMTASSKKIIGGVKPVRKPAKKDDETSEYYQEDILDDHIYRPVRFVIVHSKLDKKQMIQSLEKFNHVNNIDGSNFMIIIGSKIIKESHTMNSVRHIMIMSRPDNISTLIQIIGRAVRLGSHLLLHPSQRNVSIKIFTSKVPDGKLSFEEIKYKEKVEMYKIIQKIERLMHENAIDAYFNYDAIWAESSETKDYQLTILPYSKPNFRTKFTLDELNLSTFNAFYAKSEVEYLMYMIKRLFLEYSSAWKYIDLFNAIKSPPFHTEINTKIVSEKLFTIALNSLIFNDSVNYTEPKLQKLNDALSRSNLMDKVRNPDDKVFIERNGIPNVLTHIGEFYLMTPYINDEIVDNVEVIYRDIKPSTTRLMNITEYLKYDMNTNYVDKKIKFINKWKTISINHLELAMCDFGPKFHQEFIEEIIEYMFRVWTDLKVVKNEYHNFYIKMLYYYDLQKLIAWADTVNDSIRKKYAAYIQPVTAKLLNKDLLKDIKEFDEKKDSSGFINLLVSSINKNDRYWISTGMIKDYEDKLKMTNFLFSGMYKKTGPFKKIRADLLPVGHFLKKVPRFFIPGEGWKDDLTYSEIDKSVKENPIIIGYDSRSKTGLSVKFKLRSPMQNIKQHRDSRLIEKGAICSTKSKSFLKDVAKKLEIDTKDISFNVEYLCQQIRTKLIYNELKGRMSGKPVRWFYFIYENYEM
jgi:hypothetical protein